MKKLLFAIFLLWNFESFAATDRHLLNEMLTTVNNEYLYDIRMDELITTAASAITELDKNLTISKGSAQFYIYRNHQIYKIVPFPKDASDVAAWVDVWAQIIDTAVATSDKVALKDFAVPDLMMQKMITALDEYSHYYSEYEYREEDEENAIYTLYSDRLIDNILYIRMRIFNKQSAKSVIKSLKNHPNIIGIILDLRGNGGGMFNEALQVANLFTDNEIITYTAGRNNNHTHYYTSKEGSTYDGPLTVLVDGKTASAAEVLAGGLQEQSRAKIIGTRTFGKGTIQNITTMSNGGKLILTTEQFFTPSGKIIHQNGIQPDICLSLSEDKCVAENRLNREEDIQEAVKLLKNEI